MTREQATSVDLRALFEGAKNEAKVRADELGAVKTELAATKAQANSFKDKVVAMKDQLAKEQAVLNDLRTKHDALKTESTDLHVKLETHRELIQREQSAAAEQPCLGREGPGGLSTGSGSVQVGGRGQGADDRDAGYRTRTSGGAEARCLPQ